MAFTSETKKELENYISGHLPNKEWYGLLDGCECSGDSYCDECPYYEECGK